MRVVFFPGSRLAFLQDDARKLDVSQFLHGSVFKYKTEARLEVDERSIRSQARKALDAGHGVGVE